LSASDADAATTLQALFRFSCEVRLWLNWELLGCMAGDRLIGVAGISAPEELPWPDQLQEIYEDFKAIAGPNAARVLEGYSALVDQFRPRGPHYHLGIIGVDPSFHGKGFGRQLLSAVEALLNAHPTSIGVWLDTESPASCQFYQACGYTVWVKTRFEGVACWCLFKGKQ
jgi:GNAT superfamily N-acetyltransferase